MSVDPLSRHRVEKHARADRERSRSIVGTRKQSETVGKSSENLTKSRQSSFRKQAVHLFKNITAISQGLCLAQLNRINISPDDFRVYPMELSFRSSKPHHSFPGDVLLDKGVKNGS